MGPYRTLVLALVALIVAVGVWHGVVSYSWSGQLVTPKGAKAEFVNVTCGPPWGSAYVHIPSIPHPISSPPCAQRQQYRIMIAADVVVGAVIFVLVLGWTRRTQTQPPVTA